MKKFSLFAIALVLLVLACSKPLSEDSGKFAQEDFPGAAAVNAGLGRGINLGNALDAPVEGKWGVTLQESYFALIADSGFQSVRIPVRWSAHALPAAPYTIDAAFMARVRWAVDQALARDLSVVIDMHHYEEMMTDPDGQEARFLAMWKQIAAAFADYPAELVFELLNEPKDKLTAAKWNALLAKGVAVIRETQARRTLMVGTAPWGGIAGLGALELPADSNLIVTVHYYEPHNFTHQGADFESGADAWLGTTWRATPGQRSVVDNDLRSVAQWASAQGRPVHMGEFGTYWEVDSLSRAFYTEYLVRRMESLDIPWALWNFSSDFGIYNDSTGAVHGYLTTALLHPGNNAALDSAMATGVKVDMSKYIVFDAFDTHAERLGWPETAWSWVLAKGALIDSSHAGWYTYYNPGSAAYSPAGDTLLDIMDIIRNQRESNFASAIGDWGEQGKGLHYRARLQGDSYPYVGFGAAFSGWNTPEHYYDLCGMTAVAFKAKGSGHWWLQMITDTIDHHEDSDSTWGHFGANFDVGADWQQFVVTIDELTPKKYSPQWYGGLQWKDACNLVNALEFSNSQFYDMVADTTLEIFIDDVRLVGMEPLPIR